MSVLKMFMQCNINLLLHRDRSLDKAFAVFKRGFERSQIRAS